MIGVTSAVVSEILASHELEHAFGFMIVGVALLFPLWVLTTSAWPAEYRRLQAACAALAASLSVVLLGLCTAAVRRRRLAARAPGRAPGRHGPVRRRGARDGPAPARGGPGRLQRLGFRQVSPRHLRSNGSRQRRGAMSSWTSCGPHDPCG